MTSRPARSGTVVVVEDDPHIADLIELYLREEGFRVLQATNAARGLALVAQERPRLVVLDVGLPGEMDGWEVCRQVRSTSDVAVIMVTARDTEVDKVLGLELGADDYLVKPFSPRELVARARAVLRRAEARPAEPPGVLSAGSVDVDPARREVSVRGALVALTAREFDLLAYLAGHPGLVLTRRQLLDAVWGDGWVGDERTVDVHVRQLRRKLGDSLPLATVWGVGYRMA
ncbi:MAG: response regulator transcription factor [Acidimicrobiales bacterium]